MLDFDHLATITALLNAVRVTVCIAALAFVGQRWCDSCTCKSLDPRALEEPRRAVLVVPVLLCGQVPAVVDVIVLLLDLQAVEVCRRDGAHGVRA